VLRATLKDKDIHIRTAATDALQRVEKAGNKE
jgi:hypothetical protein